MSDPTRDFHQQDATTLARGAGWLVPGRFVGRAVSYGVTGLLLPRMLGAAGIGLFGIGWTFLLIGGLLAALGLDNGVIRFGSRMVGQEGQQLAALVRRALTVTMLCGIVAAAALFLAAPWLADEVYQKPSLRSVLQVFALGLILVPALRVAAAASRVGRDMRYSAIAEDIAQPLAQLVLVVGFYLAGREILGAAAATVLSFGFAFVLALIYLGRIVPGLWNVRETGLVSHRELLGFAVPTSLAGTLGLVVMSVDVLLVGYFRPEVDTGIYHAAARITFFFVVVLSSFNHVFAPMIADLYHQGERQRLNDLYRAATRWGLLLCLPLAVVLLLNPEGILRLLLPVEFATGALPLRILMLGQLVNLVTGAVGYLLVMSGRQNWWLTASALAVAVNIALNIVLIPRAGLVGAAVATAVALAGLFVSGLVMVRHSMKLWPYGKDYLPLILSTLAALVLVLGLGRWSAPSATTTLLQLLVAGVVIWLGSGLGRRENGILGLMAALRGRA